jgi:hypothetical protein
MIFRFFVNCVSIGSKVSHHAPNTLKMTDLQWGWWLAGLREMRTIVVVAVLRRLGEMEEI